MEWRVSAEMQEEIVSWYISFLAPKFSNIPDVLRFRLFEVDNATVLQGVSYETKAKDSLHTYFTLVELESEEWPWEAILELCDNKEWLQFFEAQRMVVSQVCGVYREYANRVTDVATQLLHREETVHQGGQKWPWHEERY